jgi:cytochrome c-type biogenesis protein CcmH/NrfG
MAARTAPQHSLSPEIAKLVQKLAKDPGSKVFIQLAEEYVKAGLLPEAVTVLEDGLKIAPMFQTARVTLGRVYHQMGEAAKAKTMLEEAVRMSPDNLMAHRMLAHLYADEQAFEPALRSCAVVLSANPKDREIVELHRDIEQKQHSHATPAATVTTAGATLGGEPDLESGRDAGIPAPDGRSQRVTRLRALLAIVQERRAPLAVRRPG